MPRIIKIFTIFVLISALVVQVDATPIQDKRSEGDGAPQQLQHLRQLSDAFAYIAEQMVPSVVTIESTRLIHSEELEELHKDEEVKEYFRFHVPKEFRQQGSGSGIIVSDDGYILTNVHVVDDAEKLRVVLSDNREYDARIIGLDPLTEVAVIKIAAKDLPVAPIGDSDAIRVGDWVLAIGNPLDLRSTVTAGIVSAKERQIDIIRDSYSVESFIQTDAAINPGNSGGALVNLYGEVIGVNTAIATENGYNAGFGFAIPMNLAHKIMSDIIHKGRVERAHLGVAMRNINEKRAQALGLNRPQGVFIDEVMADTPAERYGLQDKDVILSIDGTPVNRTNQVQAIIAAKDPGTEVELQVWRAGSKHTLAVRLDRRNEAVNLVSEVKPTPEFTNLGLVVVDLTENAAKVIGHQGDVGVIVKSVAQMSPADRSRIQEDDVIIAINEHTVHSSAEFQKIVSMLKPGSVPVFTISRNNEKYHFFVENPD